MRAQIAVEANSALQVSIINIQKVHVVRGPWPPHINILALEITKDFCNHYRQIASLRCSHQLWL
jgi:hypothetical protein